MAAYGNRARVLCTLFTAMVLVYCLYTNSPTKFEGGGAKMEVSHARPSTRPHISASNFPHWQLLSNRAKGITRQVALSSVSVCGDLMAVAAKETMLTTQDAVGSNDHGINASLGNADWPSLSHTGRLKYLLSRYGCDWYPVISHDISSEPKLAIDAKMAHLLPVVGQAVAMLGPMNNGRGPLVLVQPQFLENMGYLTAILTKLPHIKPENVRLEVNTQPSRKSPSNWSVPTPEQLVTISPTSPWLMHLLADQMVPYHHDRVPIQWLQDGTVGTAHVPNRSDSGSVASWLKEIIPEASAMGRYQTWTYNEVASVVRSLRWEEKRKKDNKKKRVSHKHVLKLLWEARRNSDMKSRFDRLLDTSSQPVTPFVSFDVPLQFSPSIFYPMRDVAHTMSQIAATMRNRLVRLSPSNSVFFSQALAEGMRKAGNIEMEGVLDHHTSEGVSSSPADALAGHWNMSDLPPWLTIPSAVNVGNCLDPMNHRLDLRGEGEKVGHTYQPGEDMHQPRRNILIIGSSHGQNTFESICRQYMYSRGMRSHEQQVKLFDLGQYCNHVERNTGVPRPWSTYPPGEQPSNNSDQDYFAVAFCRVRLSHLNELEDCAEGLMGLLPKQSTLTQEVPPFSPTSSSDRLTNEFFDRFPVFSNSSLAGKEFRYQNFFMNTSQAKVARLKGIFSHIIYFGSAWEISYQDDTIMGYTESTAIVLDLLEEIFEPREKIILYNLHGYNTIGTAIDPTGAWMDVESSTIPNFLGRRSTDSASLNKLSAQLEKDLHSPLKCMNQPRTMKFRDASLLASWPTARERVRAAWKTEFEQMMNKGMPEGSNFVATDTLERRAPVEVADFNPQTMQSFAAMFADDKGHHYTDVVLEALAQRILRDHVCPPHFVMAVDPATESPLDGLTTNSLPGQLLVDHARSKLPSTFHFKSGSRLDFLRVVQDTNTASEMPILQKGDTIRNLFPLTKMPSLQVMEGLYRAVFDNDRSLRGEGAVYRHSKHRGIPEAIPNPEVPVTGTLNQYDPFAVSPFCSCLRGARARRSESSSIIFTSERDTILNVVLGQNSSDANDVNGSLTSEFIRLRKWQETEDDKSRSLDKPLNYSASPLAFELILEPQWRSGPEYPLLPRPNFRPKPNEFLYPAVCQQYNLVRQVPLTVYEELRRRIAAWAHIHKQANK